MTQPAEPDRRARRRLELRRRAVVRRRRLALGAIALAAVVAGVLAGSRGDGEEPELAAAPPPPVCPTAVAADPRRLVGQMLVVRMESQASADLRRRARLGEIGGVVLFPAAGTSPSALRGELRSLRSAARAGGSEAPLVMIDQEGGEVKRLPGLPPERPPQALARGGEPATRAEGNATGAALARIGVNVDLAPVLDVPAVPGAFIASRAFGSDPEQVAALGTGFGEGLQDAGVAATAKHFPGLGLATANTDLAASTIEGGRNQLNPGLEPFRAAIEAGFGLVMVSNAVYPAYDARRPASLSPRLIDDLLRRRLGFDGVVVSDDLGAGALVAAGIDEGEAAVEAARAGVDQLLFALSDGSAAHAALLRALRRGELEREGLIASCARSTALRERFAA